MLAMNGSIAYCVTAVSYTRKLLRKSTTGVNNSHYKTFDRNLMIILCKEVPIEQGHIYLSLFKKRIYE